MAKIDAEQTTKNGPMKDCNREQFLFSLNEEMHRGARKPDTTRLSTRTRFFVAVRVNLLRCRWAIRRGPDVQRDGCKGSSPGDDAFTRTDPSE